MPSDEFITEVRREPPDFAKLKRLIIEEYNKANGTTVPVDVPPDGPDAKVIRTWLNKHFEVWSEHFLKRRAVTVPLFSPSLSAKISMVSQYHCPMCSGAGPVSVVPIRIRPTSYQASNPAIRRAFKLGVKHWFAQKHAKVFVPYPGNARVCLHIVYVTSRARRDKDVDNMIKLLNDGLEGVFYDDDSQIDHLSVLKMPHAGQEEWIYVNIRPSWLNDHRDVMFEVMDFIWGVGPAVNLDDFIDLPRRATPHAAPACEAWRRPVEVTAVRLHGRMTR